MGVVCCFRNVGEFYFGCSNGLCDAPVWRHNVDSYVNISDFLNIAFFQKTVCCRTGVNDIYENSFFEVQYLEFLLP